MTNVLLSLGRGIVKLLIGLFVGFGVGLVIVGYYSLERPTAWDFKHDPPIGPMCLGIGAGLLSAGLTMFLLFFGPWARRSAPHDTTNT